jgi:hypothetical protein
MALPWLSQVLENNGDPEAAMDAAARGLAAADAAYGPWGQAITATMAAQLAMQLAGSRRRWLTPGPRCRCWSASAPATTRSSCAPWSPWR